MKEFCKSVKIC